MGSTAGAPVRTAPPVAVERLANGVRIYHAQDGAAAPPQANAGRSQQVMPVSTPVPVMRAIPVPKSAPQQASRQFDEPPPRRVLRAEPVIREAVPREAAPRRVFRGRPADDEEL